MTDLVDSDPVRPSPILPPEIIDVIFKMALEDEARHNNNGLYSLWVWNTAVDIAQHSRFRTPFILAAHKAALIDRVWMAFKCWLRLKFMDEEYSTFNFTVEIHGENRNMQFDSVKVDRNPMLNGYTVATFSIGDVFLFRYAGLLGFEYQHQIYKICAIHVPGYAVDKEGSVTFSSPKRDDVVKVSAHWFGDVKSE